MSAESGNPKPQSPTRPIGLMLIALVIGVVLGVIYLQLLEHALDLMWTTALNAMPTQAGWIYLVVLLTLGAGVVVAIRRATGVFGHSPLDGLAVRVDPIRSSLISLLAVIVSLIAGAVLGPEAGLIALGTALGVWLSQLRKLDAASTKKVVGLAVLGAVLGLVVNMGAGQTIDIVSIPIELAWTDFVWAIPVSIVSALVIVAIRLPAYYLRGWADQRPPVVWRSALIGLLIAVVAIAGFELANVDARLVIGSGEGFIKDVLALTSVSALITVIVAKGICYALCLGGGLRGGPIFPAMFIGAAVAAVFTVLGAPAQVTTLAAAGVLAATTTGLKMNWIAMIITAVVFGLLLGSPLLIPTCLVGMVIGRILRALLEKVPAVGPVEDEPDLAPATT